MGWQALRFSSPGPGKRNGTLTALDGKGSMTTTGPERAGAAAGSAADATGDTIPKRSSQDFIRAAADGLRMTGGWEQQPSKTGRKRVDVRAHGRKPTPAELKRSLWSSKANRLPDPISQDMLAAVARDMRLVGDEGNDTSPVIPPAMPPGKPEAPVPEKPAPDPATAPIVAPPVEAAVLLDVGGGKEAILLDYHVPVSGSESGHESVKEEKPVDAARVGDKYHRLSLAIAAFLFVVFVICDIYLRTNAAAWVNVLLKILPLGLGLTLAAWGLWSKSLVTKSLAAVLIGLFLMHAVARRPLQRLLPRAAAPSAEVNDVKSPLPQATTNN